MIRGNVQGSEVVVVGFHLGAFLHLISQAAEQINDLLGGGDQGVTVPHGGSLGGRRHIQGFSGDARLHGGLLHRLQTVTQQRLHLGLEHIRPLSHQGTLVAGQLAHRTEHTGEPALLAEQTDTQLLERLSIRSCRNGFGGFSFQRVELIGELLQGDGGAHGFGKTAADCKQWSRLGSPHRLLHP